MSDEAVGGRIFFTSTGRSLVDEDEIVVLSVGVDIVSSTSHLVFSRIVLERLDSRYVVTVRETFYESDIMLTPYTAEAGKLVAVSAGDNLETVMAAYGSGAVSRAIRDNAAVMNVDVGGGTSKIAICAEGRVIDLTAVDVGARLVVSDDQGRITRIEEAGRQFGAELGLKLELGN